VLLITKALLRFLAESNLEAKRTAAHTPMKTLTKITAILLAAGLSACATSPNAWKDLGDGEGMRGWAGIPLKYTVPLAAAQGLQQVGASMRRTGRGTYYNSDGSMGQYYRNSSGGAIFHSDGSTTLVVGD
jgi:hypothetical protein